MLSRYARLPLADRSSLRIEGPDTPAHIAGICVLEAAPLLDSNGELDLAAVRRRLDRRLVRVPELRRIVHRPPPLCGPPLWVDDPDFSIDLHVHAARVAPPGDEASLLDTAELVLREPLDRSRALWELWLLTGLAGGRLAAVFEIHHAVADGLAGIALVASLLDAEPDAADPPAMPWRPAPAPSARALLTDSLRCRATAAAAVLGDPIRLARRLTEAGADVAAMLRAFSGAPRTSLNAIPAAARRLRAVHLDLERARAAAHAHGAKVNDVVLAVVAGGVRDLLAARRELRPGMELKVSVPAALRRNAERGLGNAVGAIVVALPVGEPDAVVRLERIADASRAAKGVQHPAFVEAMTAWVAAAGLSRPLTRRQRLVNLFVTNVPGPNVPLYFLGSRIEEILPVTGLAGNVTVVFAALSYCGHLDVVVIADAAAHPDVDLLAAGMERAWAELAAEARAA